MNPSEFVKIVVNQYNAGKGIFQKKINAEELIPIDLDALHKALFIFYVLQLDYAMKSQILYQGANKLYKENALFFTPQYIATLNDQDLTEYLQKYLHPRYINEALKRYCANTTVLLDKYNGDPRTIFTNSQSCQEVLQKLKGFRGFGPKIGNFFVRTMINTFDYIYSDINSMLPPVDVHDVRIAFLLGFVATDEMSSKNVDLVKKLWNNACQDSNESWLVFDKALWLLGSEGKPKTKEELLLLLK